MAKCKTCLARKLLCGLLAMLLASVFIVPVSADEIAQDSAASSEPTLISRIIYPEVTDPEELLAMAMEQEPVPMTRSAAAPENDEITVTQLLEEQTYSDGSTKQIHAQTSLLVLDDKGNKISRSEYKRYYRSTGNSLGNVFASQTLYAETSGGRIRISHVTTTVTEMGIATPVTSFTHRITSQHFGIIDTIVKEQTVSAPAWGRPYTFYNPDTTVFPQSDDVMVQLQTSATIYLTNGQSFEIINPITNLYNPGIEY